MSLAIRLAQEMDCATILELIRQLAIYERLQSEAIGTVDALRIHLFGQSPVAECLIADWNGEPVGFALFFTSYSTFQTLPGLYLEDLFVLEDKRGNGIGKALFRSLATICVERGYGRFEWSVLDWNQPSIDFYEAMGARPQSDWIKYRLDGDALAQLGRATSQ